MKFTLLLSAVLAGAACGHAATQPALSTNATNSNPEAAITALFGNPVVVKAKNFEIKRSELDQVVSIARANAASAGQQLPLDYAAQVLDQLVTIQTLLQTATPADQVAGKQEADLQFTNLMKRFPSPEAFERQLTAQGMTLEELRAKATQEAVAKSALKRELNINITDEEARNYYNQHPADFEQPELAHVQHILLMTIDLATRLPLTTNMVAAKRQQIDDLRKRILGGADFSLIAKEYSEDPGTKANGGELPEFSRGQMVPEFEATAFALTNNQVSDVVTSQFGFHLIKLLDKKPAKKIDFATADQDIKEGLGRLKIGKLAPAFVKKLRVDEQVEIVDPKLKSMDEQLQAAADAAAAAADADSPSTNAGKF